MSRNIFNRQVPGARVVADQSAGSAAASYDLGQEPVIPLPNPGEGGPVYPGPDAGQEPMIPLPGVGEGGPVYPGTDTGSDGGISDLMPNPGEGGPLPPYDTPTVTPVLPNPGGSGSAPVITINPGSNSTGVVVGHQHWSCPNNNCSTIIGSIVGSNQQRARVRFLNAAYGYRPFRIFISNTQVVNLLNFASASSYVQAYIGYQTVTVSGTDGYIYIQKTIPFQANTVSTIAIINTASGLDLLQITDTCCPPTNGYSSFRIGNLAYNSGPLDVLMSDGRVVYGDLRYKEIGAFKRIVPGTYQFFYADTNLMPMPSYMDIETLDSAWLGVYPPHETFGSLYLDIASNAIYSVYLLQSGSGRNQIQNLILMDR